MAEHSLLLESRSGLPEALRVLLDEYPRNIWDGHSNFDGLVRFWLERHLMFRKFLEHMQRDLEHRLEGQLSPDLYSTRLARIANMFIGELTTHHTIEDQQYFPILVGFESDLQRGFEILDKDHHALDFHLENLAANANRVFKAGVHEQDRALDAFHDKLQVLHKFLDRHLIDEEELIVPIILKHGFEH